MTNFRTSIGDETREIFSRKLAQSMLMEWQYENVYISKDILIYQQLMNQSVMVNHVNMTISSVEI